MRRKRSKTAEFKSEPGPPTFLVRWRCPNCRTGVSAFVTVGDRQSRYCKALRSGSARCGTLMDIVQDLRPREHFTQPTRSYHAD
jgi:hypothetical protein